MKKGLYVILIFLVIVSITGIAIAAKPDPLPLPSQGPIGDLKMQIADLLAVNTNLQTQIDQLTAENAALKDQLMLCEGRSYMNWDNWQGCERALSGCKSALSDCMSDCEVAC